VNTLKKKKSRKKRFFIVGLVFSLVFFSLLGRLIYVMGVEGQAFKKMALDQWTKKIAIQAKRGEILDRNGSELAVSIHLYRIDADLAVLRVYIANKKMSLDEAVNQLSNALGMNKSDVQKILDSKDDKGNPLQFVPVKRKVEKKVADAVKGLKYSGIIISGDEVRMYPNNSFLAHVIGSTDWEGNGINGVEQSYNKELAGDDGSKVLETDRDSNEFPDTETITKEPVDGKDLTLTVDTRIQMLAERVAKETLTENSAKSVSITIMNPSNGEILAMANSPSYDLNKPNEAGKTSKEIQENWKNRAVSNIFEPGSIFKVITSAAALQNNVVTDKDRFQSTGSIKVGNKTLYNDRGEAHGSISFSDIIRYSDNVGFILLGQKIGKENFYKYITDAGFGQKTGIDLPGESSGIVRKLKDIGPVEFATMSYGQGVAVTQVQYLAAFNAVANGGTWIRPHVMKEISHNVDGKKVIDEQYDNLGEKTIISKEKAAQLRGYLETVVTGGTATATYMEGYHIAGKTGTANKVNTETGGYETNKYVASFAGMAPTDNPKVTLIVTVEEPSPDKYYAAETAVPAAKKLFTELFTILNIDPDSTAKTNAK
jgi:stage V sporulation protein D (sporulation-specific penicillin-binding protein)